MDLIKNFKNYKIDKCGNVYSIIKNNFKSKRITPSGYVIVDLYQDGKCKTQYLHRLLAFQYIENPNSLKEVNHIDGNKQNNSLDNLEWCTREYNCKHKNITGLGDRGLKKRNNTSGFVGVSYDKQSKKWKAYIVNNGKMKHLGRFSNKLDAAIAYNNASKKYHGYSGNINNLSFGDLI